MMCSIYYLLDSHRNIKSISGDWDAFAKSNGAEQLATEKVIGNSIFDFMSGKVTKQFYEQLIKQAHTIAKTITFDYRCDSPEQKRFMELHITPLDNGETAITSHFLGSRPLKKRVHTYLVKERTKQSKISCSLCNKIQHQKVWLELEDCAINNPTPITYGICEDCSVRIFTLGHKR